MFGYIALYILEKKKEKNLQRKTNAPECPLNLTFHPL